MSNYERKSQSEKVSTSCPECAHQFDVEVEVDVSVESYDPDITIKVA